LKPKSKKSPDLLLFQHEDQSPFSGAYTNAIYARRRANGKFTVWVKAWSGDGSVVDCWQKDIASAPEFVSACQTCLEFVEFGDADVLEVVRAGFQELQKADRAFADQLRTELREQFSEDCAAPSVELTDSVGGKVTVTRLSNEEARKKYGSSMVFIADPDPKAPKAGGGSPKGPRR
jgi:hypothetical protein